MAGEEGLNEDEAAAILKDIENDTEVIEDETTDDEKESGDEVETEADETESEEPKLFAGKYKSPEDLEKAYNSLQKKLGEKNTVDTNKPRKHGEAAKVETKTETVSENWKAVQDAVSNNRGIPDAVYDELNKAGVPDDVIDSYADGIVAKQNEAQNALHTAVGGEDRFNKIVSWSNDALSDGEKSSIKAAVESGGGSFALEALAARYDKANPVDADEEDEITKNKRLKGKPVVTGSIKPYNSQREMLKDIKDPRYENDEKFQDKVAERIGISNF